MSQRAEQVLNEARRVLARLPAALTALTGDLDDAGWRTRPADGKWTPIEIVCHLRDEEVEDFGARVRAVVEGLQSFAPIAPDRWVAERRYSDESPSAELEALFRRRALSLRYLAELDPAKLEGTIETSQGVKLSGMDLVAAWATHDLLHLRQLAGTLARIHAGRWPDLKIGYAGTLPY